MQLSFHSGEVAATILLFWDLRYRHIGLIQEHHVPWRGPIITSLARNDLESCQVAVKKRALEIPRALYATHVGRSKNNTPISR